MAGLGKGKPCVAEEIGRSFDGGKVEWEEI
jgi:hypothetical protein